MEFTLMGLYSTEITRYRWWFLEEAPMMDSLYPLLKYFVDDWLVRQTSVLNYVGGSHGECDVQEGLVTKD